MSDFEFEISKNLIIAGAKFLTLHDEGILNCGDPSSNFFEKDFLKTRAAASASKLQKDDVVIHTLTEKLTKEHLSRFQVVIFTYIRLEEAIDFSNYCHTQEPPIAFIKTDVQGLFGSVFCDFGPNFSFVDVDQDG
ncbi:hypothetical protein GIB67_030851, partial [Kingdonia uniflora]